MERTPTLQAFSSSRNSAIVVDTYPREKKQDIIRKLMYFVDYDARLKAMSEHPELRDVSEPDYGCESVHVAGHGADQAAPRRL